MPTLATCTEVRVLLDRVRVLKLAYDQAYRQAMVKTTHDAVHRARVASDAFVPELKRLKELLWFIRPEQVFDLRRQYESQIELLKKYGLVQVRHLRTHSGESCESIKNKAKGEHYPRLPLQGNNTARQCLSMLNTEADGRFQYESGMTPEDWIMTVITHAEATGTLLDHHLHTIRARNAVSFLTGSIYMSVRERHARAITISCGKCPFQDGSYRIKLTNLPVDRSVAETGTARHVVLV